MTPGSPTFPSLTPREREILRLLGDGLSNPEIAERLVVSPQTVKWYVKEVYSKLGVHSRDEALALLDAIEPVTEPAASSVPHNLPALVTSLIGRTHEITALRALLRDPSVRLVTLLGPPGIGKTRLSIETAHRLVSDFPDGVFFVALAPLSDPALVGDAILSVLGLEASGSIPAAERLRVYLRNKRLLLVLDNLEHLLPAASLIGDLLAVASGVKVLATSREPLRIYGEREYPVPPLDPASEAVALFEARAQAVHPDFAVNEQNIVTVTAICQKLDGLPLAIELAAARMKLFTAHALLGRLSGRLSFLTGGARDAAPRQQTLRAAIDWSYDLLTPDEQRLFARFAVFEGGASLEAFAEICGFELALDPFDGLESLVGKSLIKQVAGADGEPRFMMLEMLRDFAAEKLAESGEEEAVREAHARHYLMMANWAGNALRTPNEARGISQIEVDYPNMRAAWLFSAAQPDDTLIDLAAETFARAYYAVAPVRDGVALYEAAVAPRRNQGTLAEADLLIQLTELYDLQTGKWDDESESMVRRAVEICKQLGRPDHMAQAIGFIGMFHSDRGEFDLAEQYLQETKAIAHAYHIQSHVDWADLCLALVQGGRGNLAQAVQMLDEQRAERRQRNVPSSETVILANLVYYSIELGDLNRAGDLAHELFDIATRCRYQLWTVAALDFLSFLTLYDGELDQARQYALQRQQLSLDSGYEGHFADSCAMLASIAAVQGDLPEARRYLMEAVGQAGRFSHERIVAVLSASPFVARCAGQRESAAELAAFVIGHADHRNDFRLLLTPLLAELQSSLTPETYAAAWARGEAMTIDDALELARELAAGDGS